MNFPKWLRSVIQFSLFTGIGVLILYFVYKSQEKAYQAECALKGIPGAECSLTDKLLTDFSGLNYAWVAVVILCFLLSNVVRAHRWLMLVDTLGHRASGLNAFFTIMVGYFANLGLPRVGEVVRAGLFARYEKIGVEKVMGTIVVDRVLDLFSLLVAILLAILLQGKLLLSFFANRLQDSVLVKGWLYVFLGLVLVGLMILYRYRRVLKRWSLYRRIQHLVEGFRDGLRSLSRSKNKGVLLLDTALIWFLYFFMMYFCFKAFNPTSHLGGLASLMAFVFGGLGIVFPSPGGMGTYHAMVILSLGMYGIAGDDGFSFANIQFFSVNLFGTILFGLIGMIFLPLYNRRRDKAAAPTA